MGLKATATLHAVVAILFYSRVLVLRGAATGVWRRSMKCHATPKISTRPSLLCVQPA